MAFSRLENLLVVLTVTAVITTGACFVLKSKKNITIQAASVSSEPQSSPIQVPLPPPPLPPPQKLPNPPAIINSVYLTGYSAGSKSYLDYLSNLLKNTEINAVVIDVKGSDGYVTYDSGAPDVQKFGLNDNVIPDIDSLVRFLHDKNVYVIGRIAVFEDSVFANARPDLAIYDMEKTKDRAFPVLWKNNGGISWMDPASKDVWDYNVSLAKDAFANGFDEVNFDYVRFPSDGKTENMGFPVWDEKTPMATVINNFFHYVRTSLPGEKISVDLFGLTTINTNDMGIGQIIENAFTNFDYVSPMVYPSHYANGFMGFANPADHPYEVVQNSMTQAEAKENNFMKQEQESEIKSSNPVGSPAALADALVPAPVFTPLAKFRPWLQDFNLGANYTASMVEQEIRATKDSLGNDYTGFMLWNPSNIYTQSAVLKQNQ